MQHQVPDPNGLNVVCLIFALESDARAMRVAAHYCNKQRLTLAGLNVASDLGITLDVSDEEEFSINVHNVDTSTIEARVIKGVRRVLNDAVLAEYGPAFTDRLFAPNQRSVPFPIEIIFTSAVPKNYLCLGRSVMRDKFKKAEHLRDRDLFLFESEPAFCDDNLNRQVAVSAGA